MDRQDELLEREDGRFFAIDKLHTGLGSLATSERLGKKVVSFGLPSGPALFLHLAFRAHSAIKSIDPITLFDQHDQGWWPDDQRRLFDFLEQAIAHVVFSFTAIEAFVNEVIPKEFRYTVVRDGQETLLAKPDIERQVNLDEKLHSVLPQVLSVPSPKGRQVWERYKTIKKTRDRIVHLKSVDRSSSGPDDETLWGTMLKVHKTPFCDYAHAIIGHYKPAVSGRRWYKKYPYA